ncbi:hypothetical protein RD792_000575 [Penstemon davidsonii]|uniref:Ubiquitin-like domain-containing protein n=1 Tax=Penstemon davidsonii TaxID=160366 RepID=A0ABR0DL32_9LAMI|nr:hypothetical protein RD792_000575 [Penstemon davidsonii]
MAAEELVELKFRLADGSDIGPSKYNCSATVTSLKEKIISQWPKEKENGPKSVNDIRLINAGKILENNRTVAESRVPLSEVPGGVITMLVVVRPPLPDKHNVYITPSPPVGLNNRRHRIRSSTADKNYPPPITCLARTENLPSHMPWVMKKYYSSDGRLIIKEEKVEHHEYFTAHRSNGRLVLNLVPLDDTVEESCREHQNAVEEINGGDE